MTKISNLAATALMSTMLAATPVSLNVINPLAPDDYTAFAKDGGNGNGGGGNRGGNGGGERGKSEQSASRSASSRDKSESRNAGTGTATMKDPIAAALDKFLGKKSEPTKRQTPNVATEKSNKNTKSTKTDLAATNAKSRQNPVRREAQNLASKLGSLNSLKRDYHAYMNSQSPEIAAIRAYVMAYAQFELENGAGAEPIDPALSDEALSAALISAANKNISTGQSIEGKAVDSEVLTWAKDVLGVGSAIGKIDQVREELAAQQATEVEPPAEPDQIDLGIERSTEQQSGV